MFVTALQLYPEGVLLVERNTKKWSPKMCGPNPNAPDENYITLHDGSKFHDYLVPKREMRRGGRGGLGMPADVPLNGGQV
jgi:hypothetical protein